MNPLSNGCQLCLDPLTESFTTIDSPVLKDQMEKVFCFSVEPKQGYYCGVCQSCSNTISEFYQYSVKVRRNQEVLNGNVTNCRLSINSKVSLEIIQNETLDDTRLQAKPDDACEPENDSSEKVVRDPSAESRITLGSVKHKTLNDSGLLETTKYVGEQEDKVLEEQEDLILDSTITLENVKIEMINDLELLETTENIGELDDEGSGKADVLTSDSKIMLERVKIKTHSDSRISETIPSAEATELPVKKARKLTEEDQRFSKYLPMICDLCGTPAESFLSLRTHFRREHKIINGYVVCCNKKLYSKQLIRQHIDFHVNPDVFQCEICEIKFKTKNNLDRHMRSKHSSADQHPFKCNHCSQTFAEKPDLTKHKKMHQKVPCPKCNKLFRRSALSVHMSEQHRGREWNIVCDICGKEFSNKKNFKRHNKRVHDQI